MIEILAAIFGGLRCLYWMRMRDVDLLAPPERSTCPRLVSGGLTLGRKAQKKHEPDTTAELNLPVCTDHKSNWPGKKDQRSMLSLHFA